LASPGAAAAQRRPLTPTRAAATVRAGWSDAQPPLSRVAPSAPLEEALLQTFARLRDASEAELRALEGRSDRAAAVIDRYRDHRRRVQDRTDRHDLLALATEAVRAGSPVVDELGPVVVHLPRRLGRSDLLPVEALDARRPVTVVLGVTGDPDGDRPLRRLLDQLGQAGADEPVELPPRPPASVVLAPDPDEEAREAVRLVLEHLDGGALDLDRIAVVARVESPYRLLLHEHLEAAGLEHHVDLPWSVAQSLPGRVLLGLLDLPDHDFRRVEVARWLRSGPLRWRGHPVPSSRWDRVARRAGVVQGLDQWRSRLDRRRDELTERAARDADDPEQVETWQRRIAEIDALQTFVLELADQVPSGRRLPWAAWSTWAGQALDDLLGGDDERSDWKEDDEADLRFVHQALAALAELDEVEDAPDVARFRRVLADELGRQRRRVGHLGRGVQVGDLESVYGQDLDLVLILGMAEGWHPPRRRDDPLLPDHELAEAGIGEGLGRPDRSDDRRDHLAARVAGASVVLLAPRSDPRGQRELQPARWLLEELSANAGRRIALADVAGLEAPWLRRSPSFEDTVRTATTAIEVGERDLTALLRSTVAGSPALDAHPVARADGRLRRGLAAVAARRDRRYGEWTGDVGARDELRFHDEATPSATRLERYALCPFQYLLDSVLRVHAHDDPVDVEGITPRDRGSLVHEVLETFVGEQLGRPPDQPWSEEDRRRLEQVLDEVGEEFRARGMTGRDLGWELESAAIRRWLGAVLDRDDDERAQRGMSPAAVELMFGDDANPPAEVALPDGRRLHFRGMVDRIDRAEDGTLLVLDYKTGKGTSYRPVDDDRLDRGRRLQLPIYADAARRAFAEDGEPPGVDAYYWFVEESGRKAWRGGPVDDEVQERFESVVGTIVDGIESGRFPANPGDESYFGPTHCGFCDYNRVCPSSRVDLWEGVREDEALAEYTHLAEGEVP
jgi:hypothetical protein